MTGKLKTRNQINIIGQCYRQWTNSFSGYVIKWRLRYLLSNYYWKSHTLFTEFSNQTFDQGNETER